jgi:hypothetical protein
MFYQVQSMLRLEAGVGIYRAGETWVEPAFASNITVTNASTTESARTFVVRVTER